MNFLAKLRWRALQGLFKKGLETGNGLRHTDSGLHASKRPQYSSWFRPVLLLFIESQRKQNVRWAQRGHFKICRKNAYYLGSAAIQRNRFAENQRVPGKPAFPE